MIKNVIFDIGGVLVDFRFENYMKDLGMSAEQVKVVAAHMIFNPLWNELDRGVRPFDEVMNEMKAEHPEDAVYYDLFWKDPARVCLPFPKTRVWLTAVKNAGYDIYLLSNYPKDLFECHWEHSFDFIDIPKGKVVSYEVGYTKPEPQIYEILLQKYNLRPEECVFLDDRLANVEAAKVQGLYGIHVVNQDQAMAELQVLLRENGQYGN